jgi:hypothetical protein
MPTPFSGMDTADRDEYRVGEATAIFDDIGQAVARALDEIAKVAFRRERLLLVFDEAAHGVLRGEQLRRREAQR